MSISNDDMALVDSLSGDDFEKLVAAILRSDGWEVTERGGARDRGADLLVKDTLGATWAVQAKRYARTVSYRAIQEASSSKKLLSTDHAALVSNAPFSKQTEDDADALGVTLWGRAFIESGLARLVLRTAGLSISSSVKAATPLDADTKIARDWLDTLLQKSPMTVAAIRELSRGTGLKWSSVERARRDLAIRVEMSIANRVWWTKSDSPLEAVNLAETGWSKTPTVYRARS